MRLFRYAPSASVIVPAVLALILSGCSALNPLRDVEPGTDSAWGPQTQTAPARPSQATPPPPPRVERPVSVEMGPSVRAEAPRLLGSAALAVQLREATDDWLGIPYRYGGTTRSGIDCSAFVQSYMDDVLGLELPRTTATQVLEGTEIDKEDLRPGDLVFFLRRRTRHVGVYLGDSEFIHASSSNGVIVSRLDEGYYQRHYWTARRVLDDPSGFIAERPAPSSPDESPRPGATPSAATPGSGW